MPPASPAPRWTVRLAAALLTCLAAAGCEVTVTDPGSDPGGISSTRNSGDVRARLAGLTVAKAGSMRGYSRDKFPHWRSTGDNCDVRDTVLKRDGTKVKVSGCNVVAGTWVSVYDGDRLTDPAKVDIDHMVPLANAWRSGASSWTTQRREEFANDLDDPQLVAVSAAANRSKGDQDPSTWKPERTEAWCQYAADWITVKSRWELTVTDKEKAALTDMLEKCR
ncbi:HNH endonuclease family protein [Couchioplanes azureus]|uniref:HNH endonuclease family protein n=1 Tax=Couchioplanes caeruleus TaxID=56438 RepID=UPI001E2D4DF4|nr:HNH endonuclease family protein [Couchioplanes caeruleus]